MPKEMSYAEQARQLAANMVAVHKKAALACKQIDRAVDYQSKMSSSTGAHSDTRERVVRALDSIHDIAMRDSNPMLRAMLRKLQDAAYK